MTTLVKLLNEKNLFKEIKLTFKNKRLVSYETDNEEYFGDVINDLLSVLIEEKMVTFLDDVPNMVVSVSIDENNLFIETFHHNMDDENEFLFDRDIDVPMVLKDFKLKVYQKYGVPIV